MKKTYEKPEVYFESFELSTSIATGCEYKTNHAMNICTYDLGSLGNVFVDSTTNCNDIKAQGGKWQNICYHLPSDQSNLFTS
jgi:hypothetical protein